MKWLILALGIVAEVGAVTFMKTAEGFTKVVPSVLSFIFMGISMAVFIFALKRFDLSFAYAIYAGLGILLIAVVGFLYFKEPVSALKIASIILIVLGVIGLNISDLARN